MWVLSSDEEIPTVIGGEAHGVFAGMNVEQENPEIGDAGLNVVLTVGANPEVGDAVFNDVPTVGASPEVIAGCANVGVEIGRAHV